MSTLLDIIDKYESICKHTYRYELSNGMNIDLVFKPNNLPHLLGLHKLKDVPLLGRYRHKKVSANVVFKEK